MATYKKPASLAVSQKITAPGWYHFLVNSIDDPATKPDGSTQDAIRLNMTCVGGQANPATDSEAQVKKSFDPLLFNPSESHRDGGEFASKVHLRLADACNLPIVEGPDGEVEIDWSKVKAQQIIVAVDWGKERDGKRHLEIDGAHIYHIDDQEVKHVPKNNATLSLLPANLRRIPKGQPAKGATNGNAAGKTTAAAGATKTPPATQTVPQTVDPDTL